MADNQPTPRAKKANDLVGRRFGRLTVLEELGRYDRYRRWLCRCDCGGTARPRTGDLNSGNTQSCGCLCRDVNIAAKSHHGHAKRGGTTPTYKTWLNMIQRCTNPKSSGWAKYGGRGIAVHPQWVASFQAFLDFVGERPGPEFSIDRIRNDGNYEPGNVRWATRSQQGANRRPCACSGLKGAHRRGRNKWSSEIARNGVRHFLGVFATPEDAHRAYISAAKGFDAKPAEPVEVEGSVEGVGS